MSLDHLIKEWHLIKFDIKYPKTEEEKNKNLKYAKSIAETAMLLYDYDLYDKQGGID